ncbi:SDR family NAD(P)-dependent oxidoreductase [Pseudomonas tohonis]|uniref:SDR family NAD(P)-dependent oxidoreductase n=1 Tax=Pseudomonas tohonis TaxID=2725477 RepID=UPI0022F0B59A|nr:SDR family NAD(P)-dependent oxidoreductase [Pseudomonas tohonis]
MSYSIENRIIAITGSTGGLGNALAKALRDKGAKLALLDLSLDAANAQAQELGGETVAKAWEVNVRSLQSLQTALDAAAKHFGGLDVVIANAGVGWVGALEFMAPEAFDSTIDINLNGVWRTFRAALPHIRNRKGYMLAISSMAAFVHNPVHAHYAASKAGVWALCDSLRTELRHQGIGVGSVHPTFFRTPMMDEVNADPVGNKLWEGNTKGLWKYIDIEHVIGDVVAGIEKRADIVVVPKGNTLVAQMPGLFRRLIERLGYSEEHIAETLRIAASEASRR